MSMISCSGCCSILNILLYDALWYYKKNIEIKKINDAEESSLYEGRMTLRDTVFSSVRIEIGELSECTSG